MNETRKPAIEGMTIGIAPGGDPGVARALTETGAHVRSISDQPDHNVIDVGNPSWGLDKFREQALSDGPAQTIIDIGPAHRGRTTYRQNKRDDDGWTSLVYANPGAGMSFSSSVVGSGKSFSRSAALANRPLNSRVKEPPYPTNKINKAPNSDLLVGLLRRI